MVKMNKTDTAKRHKKFYRRRIVLQKTHLGFARTTLRLMQSIRSTEEEMSNRRLTRSWHEQHHDCWKASVLQRTYPELAWTLLRLLEGTNSTEEAYPELT